MADTNIDISRYLADKALGIAKIVKLNGQAFYSSKEFDRTGNPVVVNIPLSEESLKDMITGIKKTIGTQQASLASVEQVLVDIAAATELLL